MALTATSQSGHEEHRRTSLHRGRLILLLALTLVSLSVAQKAYRLSLPTDGWSTTNASFESDDPSYLENLAGRPSPLRAGDRLIAVGGVPFLELELRSLKGQRADLGYEAGETVRYTVLREGEELDLQVPLHPGSSIGLGKVLPQLFAENQVGSVLLWVALAIAGFVFWKRPENLTAQLLFLQMFVTLASAVSWLVSPLSAADALRPESFYLAAFFTHWIHALLEQPLGLHLILSFPRPNPILKRRWALPLLYGLPFVAFALIFALPEGSGAPMFVLVGLYNLLGIVLVVRLLFTQQSPVERLQVRWFGFGYAVSNLGTLLFALWAAGALPDGVNRVTEALPFNLVFLLCTAVAILRYRLFDIDVILSRTLVWGGLTAVVVGGYVLVVGGLGRLVGAQSSDLRLSLMATGLIAVAFSPLRTFFQRGVNRLLFGDRDDPYKVLHDLSRQLGAAPAPTSVLPALASGVARALKLPYVAVVLEQEGVTRVVAEHGTPQPHALSLPLSYQHARLGELRLAPRDDGGRFGAAERKLLGAIAQQTSVAAYAATLTQHLQHSREQLVTTREEERRRLRRDLHDGLGPTLAGMTLRLDAARNLLRHDAAAADGLLLALKAQTQAAISDIRQLVYALRPPALDDHGLGGALLEQLQHAEAEGLCTTLELPESLPTLPAATEVAVFRIVQEALTNVRRHACASRCDVRLEVTERLRLTVCDDGVGIPAARRLGIGLRSMRERAEELGGTLSVSLCEPAGTQIVAQLPLPEPLLLQKGS